MNLLQLATASINSDMEPGGHTDCLLVAFAKIVGVAGLDKETVTAHPQRVLDNGRGLIDTGIPG